MQCDMCIATIAWTLLNVCLHDLFGPENYTLDYCGCLVLMFVFNYLSSF